MPSQCYFRRLVRDNAASEIAEGRCPPIPYLPNQAIAGVLLAMSMCVAGRRFPAPHTHIIHGPQMQVNEKSALAPSQALPSPIALPARRRQVSAWRPWAVGAIAFLFLTRGAVHVHHHHHHHRSSALDTGVLSESATKCAQSPVLTPKGNLTDVYQDQTKTRIINWLSGSVQIPTECFDVMGPTTGDDMDKRWKVFGDLHAYFERVYPNVWVSMVAKRVACLADPLISPATST